MMHQKFINAAFIAALVCLPGLGQTLKVQAGLSIGVFDLSKIDSIVFDATDVIVYENSTIKTYAKTQITSMILENQRGLSGQMLFKSSTGQNTYTLADIDSIVFLDTGSDADYEMPGVAVLGRGYDVFGEYAKMSGVRDRTLDMGVQRDYTIPGGKTYPKPTCVTVLVAEEGLFRVTSGSDYKEYTNSLAVGAGLSGDYTFFSGSIKTDFSLNTSLNRRYRFTSTQERFMKWHLKLPDATSDQFKALLSPDFIKDLNTLPPADLFTRYGTHIIRGIVVGARADYNIKTEETTQNRDWNWSLYAEAKYKSGVSTTSGYIDIKQESGYMSFDSNSTAELKVMGGNVEFANFMGQPDLYAQWIATIGANPVFCDFTNDGLVPLWALCTDTARVNALKLGYAEYASTAANRLPLNPAAADFKDCIVDVIILGSGSGTVNTPAGYTRLTTDLNQSAGGDYIYLAYKRETVCSYDTVDVVTGLVMINGSGAVAPAGYIKDPYDLNKNAGGDYIYLCKKSGPTSTASNFTGAISDIRIKTGEGVNADAGYEFIVWNGTNTPAEVNKGAGGAYIYIEYKR